MIESTFIKQFSHVFSFDLFNDFNLTMLIYLVIILLRLGWVTILKVPSIYHVFRCKIPDVCCQQRPRFSGRSLGLSDLNNLDQAERDETVVESVTTYYAETIMIKF
jgi:hypothetical protein